jgi:hypothetical protein
MTHDPHHHGVTHGHGEHQQHHAGKNGHKKRPLHHDWRLWVAVVLALVAMFAYVMSDNEAIQPRGSTQNAPMPAAP